MCIIAYPYYHFFLFCNIFTQSAKPYFTVMKIMVLKGTFVNDYSQKLIVNPVLTRKHDLFDF